MNKDFEHIARSIADVATNKREFDERISDWFTRTGTMGSNKDFARFNTAPTSSTKSSKSSRSSSLTVRRLQATLNLKSAQLQANHMRERAEEQQRKLQLDAEEQQRKSRLETELEEREALRKIALAELECKVWEEAESKDVKGPSFSNPNPSTLLTPSSVGTQFPTASMATKRVTFGQTAVSTANTSRSGYETNSGATPLNEGASRPPLDEMPRNIYLPDLIRHLPICPTNRGFTTSIMIVCFCLDLNFLSLKGILSNSSHFLITLKHTLSQGFMMNKLCFASCFSIAARIYRAK